MKRPLILGLLMCFLICCFAGCSGVSARDPLCYQVYPLTAEGELTWHGGVFGVKLEIEESGRGTLYFLSPERVSGLRMAVSEEGVILSHGERQIQLSEDSPLCPAVVSLVRAFSITDRSALTYTKDGFVYNGMTYVCDSQNGYPLSVAGNAFSFRITLYTPGGN